MAIDKTRQAIARLSLAVAVSLGVSAALPSLALAKVHISVDLDHQTIHVESKDQVFDWKVSSGKSGYDTPAGTFKVLWMDRDHHSDEYEQASMPNSIFFAPGFAIHGFTKSPWGRKSSHGCVRLPIAKSAILFDMVKAEGADITITGASNRVAPTVASVQAKQRDAAAAVDDVDQTRSYSDANYGARRQRAPTAGYDGGGYAGGYDHRQAPPPRGYGGLFGSFY